MFRAKRTALCVAMGAMALVGGEASAGCKYIPNPPGSYVCAAWIKGSEICNITTSGLLSPAQLLSATCSITGALFVDGAEGASSTTGAYCASGNPPPGLCESTKGNVLTRGKVPIFKAKKPPKKPPTQAQCTTRGGDEGPDDDDCNRARRCSINTPGSDPFLSEDASPPVCTPSQTVTGAFDCTTTAEITVPEGATCPNGRPALDFTASKMLAITEACVDDGDGGQICQKIYDFCTVDPFAANGTPYNCVDITEQGEICSADPGRFLTFDPDDPLCGTKRTCID